LLVEGTGYGGRPWTTRLIDLGGRPLSPVPPASREPPAALSWFHVRARVRGEWRGTGTGHANVSTTVRRVECIYRVMKLPAWASQRLEEMAWPAEGLHTTRDLAPLAAGDQAIRSAGAGSWLVAAWAVCPVVL
jgi:hypothetical protein